MAGSFGSRLKFSSYSYGEHLAWGLAGIAPPFVRTGFFRLIFKKFGRQSFIDYGTYFRYPFKISIGQHTWINRGAMIIASYQVEEAEIVIGNNVAIGPGVRLLGAGHQVESLDLADSAKTIIIGDNVWIGGAAIVLPGVSIGEGSVIGAGSLVTRDIPPWSVAFGSPATVRRKRELRV